MFRHTKGVANPACQVLNPLAVALKIVCSRSVQSFEHMGLSALGHETV
jgi:hypothetical protein